MNRWSLYHDHDLVSQKFGQLIDDWLPSGGGGSGGGSGGGGGGDGDGGSGGGDGGSGGGCGGGSGGGSGGDDGDDDIDDDDDDDDDEVMMIIMMMRWWWVIQISNGILFIEEIICESFNDILSAQNLVGDCGSYFIWSKSKRIVHFIHTHRVLRIVK